ncbi:MAG TPA: aminoacyl-tRNA hydrolase [Candidatus Dormibacteraeota bacterium]|jgi:PTH1 family peptidyl-tRNA hydrolase|nr:aminoacyl-tRNA hydrolase [Candidatus Dormibacteraeota bacterium]
MGFRRKKATLPVRRMVVGLGNPGSEYSRTRHNLGFMVVDRLAERLGVRVTQRDKKALVATAPDPGDSSRSILLAKPQTFMNLSGEAVAALARKHGLDPANLWLVYDELDIPFGKLRIRLKGSPGGHKGVASVAGALGTTAFPRFRVGIGRPEEEPDPVDYLLSAFNDEEKEKLPALVDLGADAVMAGLTEGIEIGMNQYNRESV